MKCDTMLERKNSYFRYAVYCIIIYIHQAGAQQEDGNSTLIIRVKIIVVFDRILHTGTLILVFYYCNMFLQNQSHHH